ncbi:hypothetical protein [Paraburkholderia azotifigens]|uniref:Uncharacterized protein n=1 Tax=Paraburkholderia azotifigens TaxID=2057004 RepID=A0A5C6VEX8_9BURK|nr:hypothetical protein [Paraburkholderia azotifigens]TXC83757.1 hypothetical protein FRZ40_25725 [Paraburkholderia azotifigens]
MNLLKPLVLISALLCGAAHAGTILPAGDTSNHSANDRALLCDSVSFATGSAQNRAACRRVFAREARPTVQTAPLTASDYAS